MLGVRKGKNAGVLPKGAMGQMHRVNDKGLDDATAPPTCNYGGGGRNANNPSVLKRT